MGSPAAVARCRAGAGAVPAPVLSPCRPRAPRTSRPAPCSTGSARSTRSRSGPAATSCAARSCTRCSSGSSTCRPPSGRTEAAAALVEPEWQPAGRGRAGAAPRLFPDARPGRRELAGWLDSARRMVAGYFALEDPSRLEPAARELLVEAVLDLADRPAWSCAATSTGWTWRRPARSGWWTTRPAASRAAAYEAKALFQLKFYALVLWRTRGTVPHQLKLMYLSDRDTLTYRPDAAELERFERTLVAVWQAIERAVQSCATSAPARAGCATGATTRRCARPSAAPRRRGRARSRPGPRTRTGRHGASRRRDSRPNGGRPTASRSPAQRCDRPGPAVASVPDVRAAPPGEPAPGRDSGSPLIESGGNPSAPDPAGRPSVLQDTQGAPAGGPDEGRAVVTSPETGTSGAAAGAAGGRGAGRRAAQGVRLRADRGRSRSAG